MGRVDGANYRPMKPLNSVLLAGLLAVCALTLSQPSSAAKNPADPPDDADAFGQMEQIFSINLSADGKRLVYVGAAVGGNTIAVVVDLSTGAVTQATMGDGKPIHIGDCDWSAADRIVCSLWGIQRVRSVLYNFRRTVAMDIDGKHQVSLGQRDTVEQEAVRLDDGHVIDWLNGVDGKVLMQRTYIREATTGRIVGRNTLNGFGVDMLDTRTGVATVIERAGENVDEYISDGLGHVRIVTTRLNNESGYFSGQLSHAYRLVNDDKWRPLGTFEIDRNEGGRGKGITPIAVDPRDNVAYVLDTLDGRHALYKITLEERPKRELVFASDKVDVDGVITIGRAGRVIGATYTTDKRYVHYFDPDYQKLHDMIARALPKLPLIDFISASADEQVLVVHASSDVEPGNWYLYDRAKKSLGLISESRPKLKGRTLSPMKAISYPAADGTQIPAYLTLPPGVAEAKNLPAIVLPHGGPGARDVWGFDWLSQFFAQRGYVVLQPNFRGSDGYGEAWFANNGFRGWKTSVGDVVDAGKWLVSQGMADPSKLGVFGWSYGGYAALQSNVLAPDLFKAVIAVAPVTDLDLLKSKGALNYQNAFVQADFIGSGPHVKEGSPAENANSFLAPVLMFQGDIDLNVDISQSRVMDRQLRSAGKSSELIVYKDLDHGLLDSTVRAEVLRKSDAFLRKYLKL
jgi:dipeptidyl aminopeptidase/acylaminoacyl peptidase